MNRSLAPSLAVTVLALALAAGCSKKEDKTTADPAGSASTTAAKVTAACNLMDEIGSCTEYAKPEAASLEKSLCEGLKGKWLTGPCPTEGVVGSCALSAGDTKRYYKTFQELKSFTVEEAQADCESALVKGTFTMAPGATRKPKAEPPAASAAAAASATEAPSAAAKPTVDPQKPALKPAPNQAPAKPLPAPKQGGLLNDRN